MYQSVAHAMGMQLSSCDWCAENNAVYKGVADLMEMVLPNRHWKIEESALYPSVRIMMRYNMGTQPVVSEASLLGWACASNHPMYPSVANSMGVKLAQCDWGSDLPLYSAVADVMNIQLKNDHWKVEKAALYPSVAILMQHMPLGASTYKRQDEYEPSRRASVALYPSVSQMMKADVCTNGVANGVGNRRKNATLAQ
mmetsp:Transcript_94273/g.141258  ORF Transcript_94273/g.141258 Transcript_94273/m.141258 type:complete len:197 (-) Transcript_94273:158-748(-)